MKTVTQNKFDMEESLIIMERAISEFKSIQFSLAEGWSFERDAEKI